MKLIYAIFVALLALSGMDAKSVRAESCPVHQPLSIAAEDGFFPYTGLYNGALRGFSLDIAAAAFDAVGCAVRFIQMPYSRCIREVQSGRHLGCFNTTDSEENKKKYIFHDTPLFRGRIMIYAHPSTAKSGPFSEEAFHTATFSVVRGYTYTDAFDNDPNIRKIQVETDLQTLALVARERADYALVYEKVAQFNIATYERRINPPPTPVHELVSFDLFISFTRINPDYSRKVAKLLDRGLRTIRDNGVYGAIETGWLGWLKSGVALKQAPPHWPSAD